MAARATTLCVEDSCAHRDQPLQRGVVQRTYSDVDSHEPDPQREYQDDIQYDESISLIDYASFLRTGVPPRGTVLITWQTVLRTELLPESKLVLLDRAFLIGDPVKRDTMQHMSGMVISCCVQCDLIPTACLLDDNPTSIVAKTIRQVPAEEIRNVHKYREGSLVVYDDWIGLIEEAYDEVSVRLSNNSVVVVDTPEELISSGFGERLSVGDPVTTKKGNLRRGRWLYGAFNPNIQPNGIVVDTRTTSLSISWLCRRIGAPPKASTTAPMPGAFPHGDDTEPPDELESEILDSGDVKVYECQTISSPSAVEYQADDLKLGDRVRFKDIAGAAMKYDGSGQTPNGRPGGRVEYIERTSMRSQGFDTNVFLVSDTQTYVKVLWQDFTISKELSTTLIPDSNFDTENDVWPGEVVCTTEKKKQVEDSPPGEDWGFEPAKVGVVQSFRPADRMASIKWFPNANVRFVQDDVLGGFELGHVSAQIEDVSVYDINTSRGLSRCRGDVVIIYPGTLGTSIQESEGIHWIGEVVDIGLDGRLKVRLSLLTPPQEVELGVENVHLAYSHDMALQDDQLDPFTDTESGTDASTDGDMQDFIPFDSGGYNELWYENEDGTPADPDGETEGWSTEDEGDLVDADGDVPMSNQESTSTLKISQTTPESSISSTNPAVPAKSGHENTSTSLQSTSLGFSLFSNPDTPASFEILDSTPPSDHHFLDHTQAHSSPARMRRIQKEHKILRSSLPEGIFVRTWESRLDLLRVLIVGPVDTPYEYAPFLVDFHLCSAFPQSPPEAFFHSWTNGNGACNPNLYEDGKICLSLLGTWHGDEKHENWSPAKSTFLQILVSLMGLVLVKDPYYNEAGYEIRAGTEETALASALYSEKSLLRTRGFITHVLDNTISGFEDIIRWLYHDSKDGGPSLLHHAIDASRQTISESEAGSSGKRRDGLRVISAGAIIQLRRQLEAMERFAR